MSSISYPYIPDGDRLYFVSKDHPCMQAAAQARANFAGDTSFPVGAVIGMDNKCLVKAGNGYNRGGGVIHICPRIVLNMPSGKGYDLCDLHNSSGHAEQMVIKAAAEKNISTRGCNLYLYGHWWCCKQCWNAMREAGINKVFLIENAHKVFSRENVYTETLKCSVKKAYISGALTNLPEKLRDRQKFFYEQLGAVCEEVGCNAYIPHIHSDPETNPEMDSYAIYKVDMEQVRSSDILIVEATHPSFGAGGEMIEAHNNGKKIIMISNKNSKVSRFAKGNPSIIYHIEYETYEDACDMLKNALIQL
jgi:deoxycytidylate deaminase